MGAGDLVYALYAGMLVTAVIGTGIARLAILWLLEPASLAALAGSADPGGLGGSFGGGPGGVIALLAGGLVVLAIIVGRLRGPGMRRPWFVAALGSSSLPLSVSLRSPVALAFTAITLAAACVVAAPAFVLVATGQLTVAFAVLLTAAGLALGLAVAGAALLGQVLRAPAAAGWAVAVAGLTVATVLVPAHGAAAFLVGLQPWAAFSALWTSGIGGANAVAEAWPSWTPLIPLALVAAAALAAAPALVDRLRPHEVLAQAQRLEFARTLGATGDIAGGFGMFREFPRTARRLGAAPKASGAWAVFVRDSVGMLRTPGRLAISLAAGAVAGGLLGVGFVIGSPALVAAGALTAFLASGAWCDGLRHAADAAGRPTLYGTRPLLLAARHALAPLVWSLVVLVLGALAGTALTLGVTGAVGTGAVGTGAVGTGAGWSSAVGTGAGWPSAASIAVLSPLPAIAIFAVLLAVVRAYDAARPPLPVILLLPIPSPVGDLSILSVLLWQSDALLVAVAVPAVVVALAAGPFAVAAALALVALAVAALAVGRFRRAA